MHRLTLALLAAACAMTPVGPAFARPNEEPARTFGGLQPDPRADVSFAGGTVKQYLDAVARAFGSANAAVQPGVESAALGPVELKNVTRRDSIMLVEGLSGGKARVQDRGDTFVLFTLDMREGMREVRVWTLAKVLSQMKAEEALSAVQAALDLAGKDAAVKFHEDTTLLIIDGSASEIDAVNQVINRLESVAEWREARQRLDEAGPDRGEIARQLERAMAKVADLEAERMELKNTIRLLEQDLEALRKAR